MQLPPRPRAARPRAAAPKNYSRGEGQKPVTQAYKDNWNAIFGNERRRRKSDSRFPVSRSHAFARSNRRITLPVVVIGISSMKAISRGYSCAERCVRTNA